MSEKNGPSEEGTQQEIPMDIGEVKAAHVSKVFSLREAEESFIFWNDAIHPDGFGPLAEFISGFRAVTHAKRLELYKTEKKEFDANSAYIRARCDLIQEMEACASESWVNAAESDLLDHERTFETWLLDEIEARTGKRPEPEEGVEETVEVTSGSSEMEDVTAGSSSGS